MMVRLSVMLAPAFLLFYALQQYSTGTEYIHTVPLCAVGGGPLVYVSAIRTHTYSFAVRHSSSSSSAQSNGPSCWRG